MDCHSSNGNIEDDTDISDIHHVERKETKAGGDGGQLHCDFEGLTANQLDRVYLSLQGVGYGMVIISGIVCVYYNIIITWTFYYLFMSMRKVLPWSDCSNAWNDERCSLNKFASADLNGTDANSTNVNATAFNSTVATVAAVNSSQLMTASEQFWE